MPSASPFAFARACSSVMTLGSVIRYARVRVSRISQKRTSNFRIPSLSVEFGRTNPRLSHGDIAGGVIGQFSFVRSPRAIAEKSSHVGFLGSAVNVARLRYLAYPCQQASAVLRQCCCDRHLLCDRILYALPRDVDQGIGAL